MKVARPERRLERLLFALECDVIEASDADILAAARELGMDPTMQGSAAFFGVMKRVHFHPSPLTTTRRKRTSVARLRKPKDDVPPST